MATIPFCLLSKDFNHLFSEDKQLIDVIIKSNLTMHSRIYLHHQIGIHNLLRLSIVANCETNSFCVMNVNSSCLPNLTCQVTFLSKVSIFIFQTIITAKIALLLDHMRLQMPYFYQSFNAFKEDFLMLESLRIFTWVVDSLILI